uniref:Uncharacterized protein n=1 Tax=Arundo donax TaxID=35708 RepID=A0A0A9HHX7_ARUDO
MPYQGYDYKNNSRYNSNAYLALYISTQR